MIRAFFVLLIVLQIIALIPMAWSGFVAFFGLIKPKRHYADPEYLNRFAVVVCAKNEAHVLSHLLKSLAEQDYPQDKWHVYLLADHCTDGTAALAADYPFVTAYERTDGPESGKGAVLAWGIAKILREKADTFDAFLVFDADNIAKPDFMTRINESLDAGSTLVQGNRIAGEPYRTLITQWYAAYWPLYSFIYSYPREKLGLSCFLTGTGFAVKKSLLEEFGWSTSSMIEDVEFAFQQCLRGGRASFAVDAVCYDEQPSSFKVMMRQLSRWCTGSYQIFVRYFGQWVRAMCRGPRVPLIDNMMLLLVGPASVTGLICTIGFNLLAFTVMPQIRLFSLLFLAGSYLFCSLAALIMTRYMKIETKKVLPAILAFQIFLWLYTLCSLYSLIFPQKRWKPIAHEGLSDTTEL